MAGEDSDLAWAGALMVADFFNDVRNVAAVITNTAKASSRPRAGGMSRYGRKRR